MLTASLIGPFNGCLCSLMLEIIFTAETWMQHKPSASPAVSLPTVGPPVAPSQAPPT